MSKSSTLLKVISILYIIFGAVTLVVALIGAAFSALAATVSTQGWARSCCFWSSWAA